MPEIQSDNNDLYTSMESIDATKTSMDEYNNVLWSENDQIVAFMKTTLGIKYQVKEQYIGTTTGGFSKVQNAGSGDDLESGQEIDHNVVLYPYSDQVWCMKYDNNIPANAYKLNVVLPETQTYEENSFANGAFPMVAVSTDNQLTFKNICGGVKLQLKGVGKIKSIKLEGIDGEAISGKSSVVAYADGTTPTITMASTASKSITLECGAGVQLNESTPTTFIIAVPPVTFTSGMKITITDTDGQSKTLTNTESNTVKRSTLLNFPVITYKQDGVLEFPEGVVTSFELPAEGGTVEIPVVTNLDYEVVIPENAKDWITFGQTKAIRNEVRILYIAENTTGNPRSAVVKVVAKDNEKLDIKYTITQKSRSYCLYYTSNNGEIVEPTYSFRFGATILSNTYKDGVGVIEFSAPITEIGDWAFYDCNSLTSVTIPDSVIKIGFCAFYGCSNLATVTIPESVTTIGDDAFHYCYSLTSVNIPDCVTSIGRCAFSGCSSLTSVSIPNCVTTIGELAFYKCSGLTGVTIGDSVTTIERAVFSDCSSLATITIPNSVTTMGDAVFQNCTCLTSVTIGDSVTTIGECVFAGCSSLATVTIGDSVTTIGEYAFFNCSNLTSVTIGDSVTTIEAAAFFNCSSLTSVNIPNSVTTIGNSAFSGCSSLTTVTIPDSVTTIGELAFYQCSGLTDVTIGNSVTTIERAAFSGCSSLATVTIGDSVTTIGNNAFSDCSSLTNLTIPNSVTTIGNFAFDDCSSLTSVTIPDSVTTIGNWAFYWCRRLISVYCKPTTPPVASIEEDSWWAFYSNASDRKIYVPTASVEAYKSASGWSDYADCIVGYDF